MIAWILSRRLIANLLGIHKNSFGLWEGREGDGLTCQKRLRDEWRS